MFNVVNLSDIFLILGVFTGGSVAANLFAVFAVDFFVVDFLVVLFLVVVFFAEEAAVVFFLFAGFLAFDLVVVFLVVLLLELVVVAMHKLYHKTLNSVRHSKVLQPVEIEAMIKQMHLILQKRKSEQSTH
jgi:hypothetical protein